MNTITQPFLTKDPSILPELLTDREMNYTEDDNSEIAGFGKSLLSEFGNDLDSDFRYQSRDIRSVICDSTLDNESTFVCTYNNTLGIVTEFELAWLGEEYLSQEEMERKTSKTLETLKSEAFKSEFSGFEDTEFFLSQGSFHIMDSLCIHVFTPITVENGSMLSPYDGEKMNKFGNKVNSIFDLVA